VNEVRHCPLGLSKSGLVRSQHRAEAIRFRYESEQRLDSTLSVSLGCTRRRSTNVASLRNSEVSSEPSARMCRGRGAACGTAQCHETAPPHKSRRGMDLVVNGQLKVPGGGPFQVPAGGQVKVPAPSFD